MNRNVRDILVAVSMFTDDFYDQVQVTLDRLEELEKQYDETKDPDERKHIQGEMEELNSFLEEELL